MDVVVGLGSNLGDRAQILRGAVAAASTLGRVVAVSAVIETEPVGDVPQGPFLNAALRLATAHTPSTLMDALLAIERRFGRVRRERWGPRTLDLDILWIAGEEVDLPDLTVPHPRLLERGFALGPLLEVAPDAAGWTFFRPALHPRLGEAAAV